MEPLEDRRLLSVWTVNSGLDKIDLNPGNGVVNTGTAGEVTLRAAIMEANAKPGADTIRVPAGYYSITRANPSGVEDEQLGKNGDLDIRDSLTILGSTTGTTTISGSRLDRVFHVQAGIVILQNLTITGGQTSARVYPYTSYGGGVLNNAVLTMIDCTVDGNIVYADVASYGGGIATTGPLAIRDSVISNNVAFSNYRTHEHGGGIYTGSTSGVSIDNTILYHNGASYGGGIELEGTSNASITNSWISESYTRQYQPGGLYNKGSSLSIENTSITANEGGGILNGGWTTLVGSVVSQNTNRSGISNSQSMDVQDSTINDNPGGGISNDTNATLTLISSTLTGNASGISNSYGATLDVINSTLTDNGGGIGNLGTATIQGSTIAGNQSGGLLNTATATVINSTLSGNHTDYDGGGIRNIGPGTLTVINSTVSGNSANGYGGGIHNTGTAIFHNSTIAYNQATQGGGGLYNSGGTATIANTICASNVAVPHQDIYGNFNSQGYNLIGEVGSATGFAATDLLNMNPNLETLANNGGRTSTHALGSSSPAVDAGNPDFNPGSFSPPLLRDQRNFPRVADSDFNGSSVVDIGAYEKPGTAEFGVDWGDAPDVSDGNRPGTLQGNPYPTLYFHNGANHLIDPNLHLGVYVDAETGGQAHPMAIGDDVNPAGAPNDEDGVVLRTEALLPGKMAVFTIDVYDPTGKGAYIDAWFDENQVGGFEPAEHFLVYQPVQHGANHFYWPVPLDVNPGNYFVRFRLTSVGQSTPGGPAGDGEVEDYMVEIRPLVADQVGVRRGLRFLLDANASGTWDGVAGGDVVSRFGEKVTDKPIVGDWNGDGLDEVGVRRGARFLLDANGNGVWDTVAGGDAAYSFFKASDMPVIGDWNGDGIDDIGVRRGTRFFLDANGNGTWDGVAGGDVKYVFGKSTDNPLAGDWNGDGRDEVGVRRGNRFLLDFNGNGVWEGVAGGDKAHTYFKASDKPVIGDWDDDGTDNIGVRRGSIFFLDVTGDGVWNGTAGGDVRYVYGRASDTPVCGKWADASPLLAAEGLAASPVIDEVLTSAELAPLVDYALAAWKATGLDPAQLERLDNVQVQVADLPGAQLGQAVGSSIILDVNAAGHGWFVDGTPFDDVEFGNRAFGDRDAPVQSRIDLLTAVMHEVGHATGLEDIFDLEFENELMYGWLRPGVRKVSFAALIADGVFADFGISL